MSDAKKPFPGAKLFQPGQSGNPGGRPKGYDRRLRDVIEGEKVLYEGRGEIPAWEAVILKAIDDAIHSSSPAARDRARNFIADRLMGKPKQRVDLGGTVSLDTEDLTKLSHEQLEDMIAAAAAADEQDDDGSAADAETPSPG